MKFSIVIPAKDEEKRIPATLAALCRYIRKESGFKDDEIEVIVVVNNSTDETYNIVRIFKKYFDFIKVFNIPNAIGKGGAIKLGFDKAGGEYIGFMDADGSTMPYEFFKLYRNLAESGKDVAIADRYSKDSIILGKVPLNRKLYSLAFRVIYKLMFRIEHNDTQCGYKVFRREVGKYLMANNEVSGWTFDLNVLLMAKVIGSPVISVPTVWEYKPESKLNIKKAFISVPSELIGLYMKYNMQKIGNLLGFTTLRS